MKQVKFGNVYLLHSYHVTGCLANHEVIQWTSIIRFLRKHANVGMGGLISAPRITTKIRH